MFYDQGLNSLKERNDVTNEPDSDCGDGRSQTPKEEHKLSNKKAAALFADLFYDQYLYNKQRGKRGHTQIDDNRGL